MKSHEKINNWNYFVSFLDKDSGDVIHIAGYEERPDVINLIHLFEELKTDEEFGMNSDYVNTLKVGIFKKKEEK